MAPLRRSRHDSLSRAQRDIPIQLSNSQVSSVSRTDFRRSFASVFSLCASKRGNGAPQGAFLSCGVLLRRARKPALRSTGLAYGVHRGVLRASVAALSCGGISPAGKVYRTIYPRLRSQPGTPFRSLPGTWLRIMRAGTASRSRSVSPRERSSGERERVLNYSINKHQSKAKSGSRRRIGASRSLE